MPISIYFTMSYEFTTKIHNGERPLSFFVTLILLEVMTKISQAPCL